jgi:tetratricopeptide (TPR) repeat protein
VKVLDFGVAKIARGDEGGPNDGWNVGSLTGVGSVVGSGPYMSPEQIAGRDVDPRSDVFSLGVVIYQMATRQLPFSGETRAEMMQSITHATPEPITRLNPEIPLELERITFKCLDKSADVRYQSARELLSDLWPLKRQVDAKARRGTPDSVHVDAPTTDSSRASEASELVALGWTHLRSGSYFGVSHAVSAFVAATTIDPTYAAAYAGLALAKLGRAIDRNVLVEAFGEAKAAALRALALDDKSADAQLALGNVMFTAEWDWIAAERSFQRALAINPNHAEAYIHYGILMEALGDLERGLHLKLQGLECDSTSALAHVWIAVSFWNQRRYDDVIVWANKALDRDPQHPFARELLMGAHWKMGNLERAGELPPHGAAQPELEWLLVVHHAEAGDLDAAFEHLHRLIDARDPALLHLAVAPQWDSLRADPRFNECLARMKLRPVGTVSGPMPESR